MVALDQKCHHIEGYDASHCDQDCKQLAKEDFAKNCTQNGGFFKCCIRYSKYYYNNNELSWYSLHDLMLLSRPTCANLEICQNFLCFQTR